MKKAQKKKVIQGAEVGGAITAAVLAASAAAYLLSDKKNQAKMKSWAKKARMDVVRKAKAARRLGKKEYAAIVDQAIKNCGSLEDVSARDVVVLGRELKGQWNAIQARAKAMAKKAAKPAKKTARRRTVAKKGVHKKTARTRR